MPVVVTCARCSRSHRVRIDAVGKFFKCKGCGKSLRIEADLSKLADDERGQDATRTPGESAFEQVDCDLTDITRELPKHSDALPKRSWSQMVIPIAITAVAAVPGWWIFGVMLQESRPFLDSLTGGLCVFAVVGVLPWIYYFGVKSNRRNDQRYDVVQRVSRRLGLGLDQFHLTTLGRFPLLFNLQCRKADGTNFAIFDYQQVIGEGKRRKKVSHTVVWLQRRGTRLPEFAIRPTGDWISRDLFDLFTGPTDINFESHPTFSSHYLLRGDNEEAIRNLFNKRVLDFFEQQTGLIVECCGNKLLVYRERITVETDDRRPLIDEANQLLALLQRRSPREP